MKDTNSSVGKWTAVISENIVMTYPGAT